MNESGGLRASHLDLGERRLEWGSRTYVMGILNLTPDSFSGDGLLEQEDALRSALDQAAGYGQAGVDLLDVGGESTRPGSRPIGADEEIARVVPLIAALAKRTSTPISVDTSKARVAEAALDAGAVWVNDVWALRADPEMAPLLAERQVPVILMHNRLTPNSAELAERLGGRYVGVEYNELLGDIKSELMGSVDLALEAGIDPGRIVLDPGIGFGKTVDQSLELVDRLEEIRALGFPVLLGPSRKSFIGFTLDLPPDERLEGTAAAVAIGIARGADIVRVHDVPPMIRVARMTDALVRRPRT
jgi:dihydropteroate synthase